MSICYIVGAGEFYGGFVPNEDDLVIAADGGYAELKKRGVRCDLLVGDLDSLGDAPSGIETVKFPVEKDDTDMRLAYLEGLKRGYTDFEIFGGVGGRSDHTFANYCLLVEMRKSGARARLHAKESVAYALLNEATRGKGKSGFSLSVFAFGGAACGVNLKGLAYELSNGTLTPDFPLGVSNKMTGGDYEISVSDGVLLVFEEI